MNEYIKQLSNVAELLSNPEKKSTSHYLFEVISEIIDKIESKGIIEQVPEDIIKKTEIALTVQGELSKNHKEYLAKKFPNFYLNTIEAVFSSFEEVPFLSLIDFFPKLLPHRNELTVEHLNTLFDLANPKKKYSDYGIEEEHRATLPKFKYIVEHFLTPEIFYSPDFKFIEDLSLYTKKPVLEALFSVLQEDLRPYHKTSHLDRDLIDRMLDFNIIHYLNPNKNTDNLHNINLIKEKFNNIDFNDKIVKFIISDNSYVETSDSTKTLYRKISQLISGNHLSVFSGNNKPIIFSLLPIAPSYYLQSLNQKQRNDIFNYFNKEEIKGSILPYLVINKKEQRSNVLLEYKEELDLVLSNKNLSMLEDMCLFFKENPCQKINNTGSFSDFCKTFGKSPVEGLDHIHVKDLFSQIFKINLNLSLDLFLNLPEETLKAISSEELTNMVCYYLEKNAGIPDRRKDDFFDKYLNYVDSDIYKSYSLTTTLNNAKQEAWEEYRDISISRIEKHQLAHSLQKESYIKRSNNRL